MQTEQLQELLSNLTEQVWLVGYYLERVQKLDKKNIVFSVIDLDDTIFSREEQLRKESVLREKRGYEWNTYMINHIGIGDMLKKYYLWKKYPKDIIDTTSPDSSLILTAWVPEYQMWKIETLWLQDFSYRIVWEWKDKILELICYIIFKLRYIPSEIIIYEDRPEYFLKYRELIEWVLGVKLRIMYVEMDGNRGYKKIEEI